MLYRIVLKGRSSQVKDVLICIPDAVSKFVETVTALAEKVELRQNHGQHSVESQQFTFWAIMNGNAVPGPVSYWFDSAHPFWYETDGHWVCLYELLFQFDYEKFMSTLESSKSPLMLLILIQSLRYTNFNDSLYRLMLNSEWDWMHDLAAEWVMHLSQCGDFDIENVLDALDGNIQLKQSAYLLSRLVFAERVYQDRTIGGESLCEKIKMRIINICNECNFSDDEKIRTLLKLSDVEETSNANLLFAVAQCVDIENIRNSLLERIIDGFVRKRNSRLPFSTERDQVHINTVAKVAYIRCSCTSEIDINKLLDWNALKNFLEPYLSDRNYEKWANARGIVSWDVQLICSLLKSGYKLSDKANEYYNLATLLPLT